MSPSTSMPSTSWWPLQRSAFHLQMAPSTADQHLQPPLVNALLESKVGPPPPDDLFKGHLQLNSLMVKSGYLRWVARPLSSVCSWLPTSMESQREQPSSLHPASRDTLCLYYLITGMVGSVLPLLLLLVSCACSPWVPAVLLHPKEGPARGPARGQARDQARGQALRQICGPYGKGEEGISLIREVCLR